MKSILLFICLLAGSAKAIYAQNECATYDYQQREISRNPALSQRLNDFESRLATAIPQDGQLSTEGSGHSVLPVINIPVVVHILYNNGTQNIGDAQVRSQLEVLNAAFRHNHADTSRVPAAFRELAADCYLNFVFATVDPQGYETSGIVRRKTSTYAFGMDDKVKFTHLGGDDAWDSDRYLNIWVCNTTAGLAGYASVPGCEKAKDGIVIKYSAFGSEGTISAPYTKGRTAVHEVGHWLGLRHIWGDQYCGDDGIADTPPQSGPTRGCPSGIVVSCGNNPSGNMYNNYMDLTSDECMNMFSIGQRTRMRAAFAEGGSRFKLQFSSAASAIPLPGPPPEPEPSLRDIIRIFPNPTANSVQVDLTSYPELIGTDLLLRNHLGQVVGRKRISSAITTMSLQAHKDGLYYLQAGNQKPRKLVKLSNGQSR